MISSITGIHARWLVVLALGLSGVLASCASDPPIFGTWAFAPSQEQSEFAERMGKSAGPLQYTFGRGGYIAFGGPLSGRDYIETGEYELNGPTLVFHRKSVGGKQAPIYERSTSTTIRFEDGENTIVATNDFGGWSFAGDEVRFTRR